MREFLLSPWVIPVAGILCGSVIAVVAIIAENWRKARQTEIEASLKQDMLSRGMTADEIVQVITASSRPKKARAAIEKPLTHA